MAMMKDDVEWSTTFNPNETIIQHSSYFKFPTDVPEKKSMPYVFWNTQGLVITSILIHPSAFGNIWVVITCHGMLKDTLVTVQLPFTKLPKGRVLETICWNARRDGVNVEAVGIFKCLPNIT